MLKILDHFSARLPKAMLPNDTTLSLHAKDAQKLNALAIGDHTYLTVSHYDRVEEVKYSHSAPITATTGVVAVTVIRGVNGTGLRTLPVSSCVVADTSSYVLREFFCQEKEGCQ